MLAPMPVEKKLEASLPTTEVTLSIAEVAWLKAEPASDVAMLKTESTSDVIELRTIKEEGFKNRRNHAH